MKKVKKPESNSFGELLKRNKDKELPVDFCMNICRGDVGFFFGPAKVGKSIFSENFALTIASGRSSFFGYPINLPKSKVFYISLEEDVNVRIIRRGKKQIKAFSKKEVKNINKNLTYSDEGFMRNISGADDWKALRRTIKQVKPDIVILDSINRFSEDIEKRKKANLIMEKVRDIAERFNCAFILIHHTNKAYGNKEINMHTMSGSSALSRNAEFFIGINKIGKTRYVKQIVNRFSSDEGACKSFEINEDITIDNYKTIEEFDLIKEIDSRFNSDNKTKIINCINDNKNKNGQIKSSVLTKLLTPIENGMCKKTLFNGLRQLEKEKELEKVKHGIYKLK